MSPTIAIKNLTLNIILPTSPQIALDMGKIDSWSESPSPPPRLEWAEDLTNGKSVNEAKALEAIEALNAKLPPGEPKWRMPTRREQEASQDLTRHDPCVDPALYPGVRSGWYWTSDKCAWSSDYAWIVSFGNGLSFSFRRDYSVAFVRAVRELPASQ
ncbi:MAG: DUF1566 domain-containing protein [Proteobacteria bacterium]|nr:DUF1566 domain-containing protein [Pseudomonadota bacterium]